MSMRKLIVAEFLTVDGVMEASEEWQPPYVSEDVAEEIRAAIHASEALLLGRVTYELFAAYWPAQSNHTLGIADKLNSQPKFVVSTTLEKAAWNNTTLIRADVVGEIRKLKQQSGGEIRLIGSATLARSLMQTGLVDEYWFLVHPIVVGRGKRLFPDGMESAGLKLVESKAFRSGVVLLRYQPDREAQ
jgi:dihydrofolate reductase